MLSRIRSYVGALLGVFSVALCLLLLRSHVNSTTVALCFLMVVLFVAALWGSRPAYLASILGVLCFNFFFLPPYHTFVIADPQNWIALGAFLATALVAGDLSSRAKRRAEEAEQGRQQVERLYNQLREAFERASEAEALKRSERLKSALLDAVTHHLRTPLTSMKAAVTTLLSAPSEQAKWLDAETQLDLLEVIDNEADRLNRFVESMMEIARIEAGQLELHYRWVSIDEIISIAMLRAASIASKHRIQIDLRGDLPQVHVDAASMTEALYNLIENACKYSPAGSEIRIAASLDASDYIRMSIEDEGVGIPSDLQERVFTKFYRVPRDASRSGGLGMGLAISRGIIEAHGGRIWIEATATTKGTRMVMRIPVGK